MRKNVNARSPNLSVTCTNDFRATVQAVTTTDGYKRVWTAEADGSIRIRATTLKGKEEVRLPRKEGTTVLCIAEASGCVWAGLTDGCLRVYDQAKQILVKEFPAHDGKLCCLAVQDGWVFSGGADGVIHQWHATKFQQVSTFQGPGRHSFLGVCTAKNSMGTKYLFGCSTDTTIRVWNMPDFPSKAAVNIHTTFRGHSQSVNSILVADNNLWSASDDSTIRVWDLTTLNSIHTLGRHQAPITTLALDVCGRVWSSSKDGKIYCWNPQKFQAVGNCTTTVPLTVIHHVGQYIVDRFWACSKEGVVKVISAESLSNNLINIQSHRQTEVAESDFQLQVPVLQQELQAERVENAALREQLQEAEEALHAFEEEYQVRTGMERQRVPPSPATDYLMEKSKIRNALDEQKELSAAATQRATEVEQLLSTARKHIKELELDVEQLRIERDEWMYRVEQAGTPARKKSTDSPRQKEVDRLQNQNQQLYKEIDSLHESLGEKDVYVRELKKNLNMNKDECDKLKKQLENHHFADSNNSRMRGLDSSFGAASTDAELVEANHRLQREVEALRSQVETAPMRALKSSSDIEHESRLAAENTRLKRMMQEMEASCGSRNEGDLAAAEQHQRFRMQMDELKRLSNLALLEKTKTIRTLETEVENLQSTIHHQDKTISDLRSKMSRHKELAEEADKRLQLVPLPSETLKEKNEALRQLQELLTQSREQYHEAKLEIAQLERQLKHLRSATQADVDSRLVPLPEHAIAEKNDQIRTLRGDVDGAQAQRAELTQLLERKEQHIQKLSKMMETKWEENHHLKEAMTQLTLAADQSKLVAMQKVLEPLRAQIINETDTTQQLEEAIKELQSETNEYQLQTRNLSSQLAKKSSQLDQAMKDLEISKGLLTERNERLDKIREDMDLKDSTINLLRREVDTLTKNQDRSTTILRNAASMQNEMWHKESKVEALQQQIDALKINDDLLQQEREKTVALMNKQKEMQRSIYGLEQINSKLKRELEYASEDTTRVTKDRDNERQFGAVLREELQDLRLEVKDLTEQLAAANTIAESLKLNDRHDEKNSTYLKRLLERAKTDMQLAVIKGSDAQSELKSRDEFINSLMHTTAPSGSMRRSVLVDGTVTVHPTGADAQLSSVSVTVAHLLTELREKHDAVADLLRARYNEEEENKHLRDALERSEAHTKQLSHRLEVAEDVIKQHGSQPDRKTLYINELSRLIDGLVYQVNQNMETVSNKDAVIDVLAQRLQEFSSLAPQQPKKPTATHTYWANITTKEEAASYIQHLEASVETVTRAKDDLEEESTSQLQQIARLKSTLSRLQLALDGHGNHSVVPNLLEQRSKVPSSYESISAYHGFKLKQDCNMYRTRCVEKEALVQHLTSKLQQHDDHNGRRLPRSQPPTRERLPSPRQEAVVRSVLAEAHQQGSGELKEIRKQNYELQSCMDTITREINTVFQFPMLPPVMESECDRLIGLVHQICDEKVNIQQEVVDLNGILYKGLIRKPDAQQSVVHQLREAHQRALSIVTQQQQAGIDDRQQQHIEHDNHHSTHNSDLQQHNKLMAAAIRKSVQEAKSGQLKVSNINELCTRLKVVVEARLYGQLFKHISTIASIFSSIQTTLLNSAPEKQDAGSHWRNAVYVSDNMGTTGGGETSSSSSAERPRQVSLKAVMGPPTPITQGTTIQQQQHQSHLIASRKIFNSTSTASTTGTVTHAGTTVPGYAPKQHVNRQPHGALAERTNYPPQQRQTSSPRSGSDRYTSDSTTPTALIERQLATEQQVYRNTAHARRGDESVQLLTGNSSPTDSDTTTTSDSSYTSYDDTPVKKRVAPAHILQPVVTKGSPFSHVLDNIGVDTKKPVPFIRWAQPGKGGRRGSTPPPAGAAGKAQAGTSRRRSKTAPRRPLHGR